MDTSIAKKKQAIAYAMLADGEAFPQLGDEFGGGYVGLIAPWSATQGAIVVVAPADADIDDLEYGPYQDDPGASSFLDGLANSSAIDDDQHPAAQKCRAYRGGDYEDWHLAAHAIQTGILANCCPIWTQLETFKEGGAAAYQKASYWSSTQSQFSSGCAWYQYFAHGRSRHWGKHDELRARPVRIVLFDL